jgi:carboxylesterase type B
MVLYGQSAGANTVLTYSYAYPESPIVTGFIASSGGTSSNNSATNSAFTDLAQQVGCANLSSTAELACMQKVDALVLQDKIQKADRGIFSGGFSFSYVADNVTVFSNLTERIEKGLVAKAVCYTPVSSLLSLSAFPVSTPLTSGKDGSAVPF